MKPFNVLHHQARFCPSCTRFLILSLTLLLVECGGGSSSTNVPPGNNNSVDGWVLIEESTVTADASVHLYGIAFSDTPTPYTPDNCPEGIDTRMIIGWTNQSSGISGYGTLGYWVGYNYGGATCEHRWLATVPLIAGENVIVITVFSSTVSGSSSIKIYQGTKSESSGTSIAADSIGNVYITGSTNGSLDGNPNAGGADAFIIKYDTNGNKLWARQFGTDLNDSAGGIATDSIGNVYITGFTYGSLDGNPSAGYIDIFIIKYDTNGNKLWSRQIGSADGSYGQGVAVDSVGNVYITGYTNGSLDGNPSVGLSDVFIIKYDTNGNKLWSRQIGSADNDSGQSVAVDGIGNVYITGHTYGSLDGNLSAGGDDVFIFKYDTNGNQLWIRQIGSAGWDSGQSVAVDGIGNAYITGFTNGSLDGNSGAGYMDIFIIKYDTNGNKLWSRQFGSADYDYGDGIATDSVGNVYITGYTIGSLDGNPSAGGVDTFTIKYDTNGNKLWARQFGLADNDFGYGVAVDGFGNAYITGYTGDIFYGNPPYSDVLTIKYDTNGNKLWTSQLEAN